MVSEDINHHKRFIFLLVYILPLSTAYFTVAKGLKKRRIFLLNIPKVQVAKIFSIENPFRRKP